MSMYFGSEFYEENHGEWLEQFIAKHGPKSLKMNRFEIEGRLGRLWNATQKLHQMFVSHDELAMYSGISRASFRYSESYARASGVFKLALVERGLLIPVDGHDDKFEIAGNRKRIEAILKKSNDGSESARRRWEKEKAMGNPLGHLCDTQCNDNDNDNDNELERDTPVSLPVSAKQAPVDYQGFISAWNENRGQLPECKKIGESRKKKIKMRLAEEPDMAYWVGAIQNLAASQFAVEGKWCDINWLIENDNNHRKASSGKYSQQKKHEAKLDFNYICGGKGRL